MEVVQVSKRNGKVRVEIRTGNPGDGVLHILPVVAARKFRDDLSRAVLEAESKAGKVAPSTDIHRDMALIARRPCGCITMATARNVIDADDLREHLDAGDIFDYVSAEHVRADTWAHWEDGVLTCEHDAKQPALFESGESDE